MPFARCPLYPDMPGMRLSQAWGGPQTGRRPPLGEGVSLTVGAARRACRARGGGTRAFGGSLSVHSGQGRGDTLSELTIGQLLCLMGRQYLALG